MAAGASRTASPAGGSLAERTARWRPDWRTGVLVAATVVQLVPLLAFPTVLTQDGPAHLDGAWVLASWHQGGAVGAALHTHYRIRLAPVPNMLTTLVLAAVLPVLGAGLAERLLLVALTAGLVAASAYAVRGVDRRASWLVLGVLPLAGSRLVAFGFYNFLAGIVGAVLVLGLAVRQAGGWSRRAVAGLALLLVATWSAHLMPWVVAVGGVGLLGLARAVRDVRGGAGATAAGTRHLVPPALAVVPSALLTAVYEFSGSGPAGTPGGRPSVERVLALLRGERPFVVGNPLEGPFALATALALLALLVAALRRRPAAGGAPRGSAERGALGGLLVVVVIAYAVIPARLGTAFGFLVDRAAWFPVLCLLLFAATRPPPRWAAAGIAAVLLVTASALVVVRLPAQAAASREVDELLSVAPSLRPGSTFVVLQYVSAAPTGHGAPDPLRHESGRLATRVGGVDIGHYEAVEAYFQVSFSGGPDLRRRLDPGLAGLERIPPEVDLPAVRGRLDYVLVVGLRQASARVRGAAATEAVRAELAGHYTRMATSRPTGLVEVWRRDPAVTGS